jgi:Undecaprenyl-phosphate glucose phosphotransferase
MDLAADLTIQDPLHVVKLPTGSIIGADAELKAKRGPMRPGALASTRRRMSGKTLAQRFKAADIATLAIITPVSFLSGQTVDVLTTPLRSVLGPATGILLALWALNAAKSYAFSPRETLAQHMGKLAAAMGFAAAGALMVALVLGGELALSVRWSLYGLMALVAVHATEWIAIQKWRRSGRLTPNIVVVGATTNARRLIEAALDGRDAAVLGVFDDRMSRIPNAIHGVPVLGDTKALLSHKLLPFIDRIVITVTPSAHNRVRELIDRLKFLPNAVTLFMDVEGIDAQRSTLSQLADAPLTQVSGVRTDDDRAGAKRLQDLVLGGLALIAALPGMTLIALAVRLDSPGPIFFRQRRHGFNNETIDVWKFRSMRHEMADAHAARQVSVNDDRVTRVGRVIRRLSLDELPQLINVVLGEMSLVGPRPHAIGMKTAGEDSARLVAEYAWRHRMKPGLTGWAQINGSIGAVDTPELVRRRVALDVEYIERQSFWFDIYILLMTLPALMGARNTVR